jgi:DNA-binding CsgD family transcriptional regulator
MGINLIKSCFLLIKNSMPRFKPLLTQIAVDLLAGLFVAHPTSEQINAAESLIVALFGQPNFFNRQQLQPNEWRCLYWAAQGKSIQETAEILQISFHTVRSYHDKIKEKLGCKKLIQAVYRLSAEIDSYVLTGK